MSHPAARGLLFLSALLLFTPQASSHDGLHRESARGLLKPDSLHLLLLWSRPAGDRARLERERADENKDGHLDRAEGQRWLERQAASLRRRLDLSLDGARLQPKVEHQGLTGMAGPSKSTEPISLSLNLRWAFSSEGPHDLLLELRPENLSGHAPLMLQLDSAVKLLEHSGRLRRRAGRRLIQAALMKGRACRVRFGSAPAKKSAEEHP